MKTITPLLCAALLIAGCASGPDQTPPPHSSQKLPEPAGQKDAVHLGMTKDEVLKALGHKPKSIMTNPRGEVWHYDNVELALIPFNFGFRPEFKNYTFDNNGILVDFNTTQPTK